VAQQVEAPLGVVYRIEKVGSQSSRGENAYGLDIYCQVLTVARLVAGWLVGWLC
jgi:hypothetical protein